jgi:hypothetical protein
VVSVCAQQEHMHRSATAPERRLETAYIRSATARRLHTDAPEMFSHASAAVDQAWRDAGRSDRPRKLALAYFALGTDARQSADSYLRHYHGFLGEVAGQIAAGAADVGPCGGAARLGKWPSERCGPRCWKAPAW